MFTHDNALLMFDWIMVTCMGFIVLAIVIGTITYYGWYIERLIEEKRQHDTLDVLEKLLLEIEHEPFMSDKSREARRYRLARVRYAIRKARFGD